MLYFRSITQGEFRGFCDNIKRMISKEDIEKLAELSRIELNEEEIEAYRKDIDAIISHVSQLSEVKDESHYEPVSPRNVMREDVDPIETGLYKGALVEEMPESKDDYVKVKKILSNE